MCLPNPKPEFTVPHGNVQFESTFIRNLPGRPLRPTIVNP